jgi:putative NIF3 family GTP cyclohydrolase 1 type 2
MPELDKYLCGGFKQTGMGLMCDFTDSIDKVYTSVFLSDKVLSKVLSDNITHAMIFSHHPTNWDIEYHGGNYAATEEYIAALRDKNISIYVLHHPLDNYGEYSTCKTLADSINLKIERPAFNYCGAWCGVIGTADCDNIGKLHDRFTDATGHKTSLYQYGDEKIHGKKIAVCPGGGNATFVVNEMLENGIQILITGVTILNDYSKEVHKLEKENGINVLGGTHYSTEKFAPIKICRYFKELGLHSEFIDDEPKLYDL